MGINNHNLPQKVRRGLNELVLIKRFTQGLASVKIARLGKDLVGFMRICGKQFCFFFLQ